MQEKLLTIVVPVYKVEPYINKCLDSCILADEKLMSQLEVFIVNDGTPDNSAEMSREYVKRYPQTFRQIDKENGGHGSAWNVGLKEATGKYLRFLDSDDWLTNLDKLMANLATCDADIVLMPKNEVRDNNEVLCPLHYEGGECRNISQFDFVANRPMTIMSFQYATYKKRIFDIENFAFKEHCSYDDTILFTAPLIKANTYVIYDFVVYNYLLGRETQSTNPQVARKNLPSRIDNLEYMVNFFNANKSNIKSNAVIQNASIIISRLAAFLLSDVHVTPYSQAKKHTARLMPYLKNPLWQASKSVKRLIKYGFTIWYFLERIREHKNK